MWTHNNIRVLKLNGLRVENVMVVLRHGLPRSFTNTVFFHGGNSFIATTGVVPRMETLNSSNTPLSWFYVISSPSLWFDLRHHLIIFVWHKKRSSPVHSVWKSRTMQSRVSSGAVCLCVCVWRGELQHSTDCSKHCSL